MPQPNALGEYVIQEYREYKENRRLLTAKWNRNWEAFRAIIDGVWKPDLEEGDEWRSKTVLNVTKQKVVSAYALIIDSILQGGSIPFMLKPSKTMPDSERDAMQVGIDQMQRLIDEQLHLCNADRALMKNILSVCIFGETYAKMRIEEYVVSEWGRQQYAGIEDQARLPSVYEKVQVRKVQPSWEYAANWNIFRDMECDDLQECYSIIERRLLSPNWLHRKKGKPYYDNEAIQRAIAEADKDGRSKASDDKDTLPPQYRNLSHRKNTILYLERWGRLPRKIVEDFESQRGAAFKLASVSNLEESDGDEVEGLVCMAGSEVIRFLRLAPGKRPYRRAVMEEALDDVGGIGVADNVEDMQSVLNTAIRGFEDNTKLAGNVILAVKERLISAMGKRLKPGMKIYLEDEARSARDAIEQVTVQNVGSTYISLIELADRWSDSESLIPKITQGIELDKDITAYELSQQVEKSGKYIGSAIRHVDEGLIEPAITAFYEYNMNDPDVVQGKGDYTVQALGFTAYQDRIVRVQELYQFMDLALKHEALFKLVRFDWILAEIAKAKNMDEDQVLKSPEQLQAEAQAEQAAMADQAGPADDLSPTPNPLLELEAAEKQAVIAKHQADAQAKVSQTASDRERLAIERAKAVAEIENMRRLPATPPVNVGVQAPSTIPGGVEQSYA